jgi:threonine/homoserine/homoserine lactone efflux protein
VVQPGPFQAFLFSESLTNGWRKTVPLVFAPLVSDIPVILLVLFILINIPHEIVIVLQCLGGVFLLYLAFKAYKNWRTFGQVDKKVISRQYNFFKAVLVNLLNPNPYIGWSLVMGPLLIKCWTGNPVDGIVLLVAFYGSMIIFSALMVILFAAAGNLGQRVHRVSILVSAIALAIFGFYQLAMGVKEII